MSIIPDQDWLEQLYIENGWALFPIKPGSKEPATRHGFMDAVREVDAYVKLHKGRPHNTGVATGPASGFWVLDIDSDRGGNENLQDLVDGYTELPDTWTVQTQSGGSHYYFAWDPKRPMSNRTNVLPGIDIRGEGGYVLAPPSKVEGQYEWVRDPIVYDLEPAPDWLYAVLRTATPTQATGRTDVSEWANGIEEGARNDTYAKIIGHVLGHNVDIQLAWSLITAYNQVYCNPPLDEKELQRTFVSIASRDLRKREKKMRRFAT